MNLDNVYVCDIECDNLLDDLTKLHVLSAAYIDSDGKWQIMSTNDPDKIQKFVGDPDKVIVGHNFIDYDKPALQKLGYTVNARIIDSLGLSWVLYPKRMMHGLESWGETFKVKKPEIADWENLTYDEYKFRCETDVKINVNLWVTQLSYLREIYDNDDEQIIRYINYINFKMGCLHEQAKIKVRIDEKKVAENKLFFEQIENEKIEILKKVMPPIPKKSVRTKPPKPFKNNGDLSVHGARWYELLEEAGLPEDYDGEIEVITGYNDPNPKSPQQVKDFLYSLGWKPETWEDRKDKDGEVKRVEQVSVDSETLCPSVVKLAKKVPELMELEGLGVIKHRLGLLKSFQKYVKNGYVVSGASSFANSIRLRHRAPIANLPKYTGKGDIRDGEYIRGCIIAPDGYEIVGSDMSSLEDRCKQHYIYPLDPEYVEAMNVEGFDPHLDLAVSAGALTLEQANAHKEGTENHKEVRHNYKTGNYSCQYGAGAPKIAKTLGVSLNEGKKIHQAYWERNWSIKETAASMYEKKVGNQRWMLNPINGFYYALMSDHTKFSLLCQGGATYVFDIWVYNMVQRGLQPNLQYHDEIMAIIPIREGERERTTKILKDSVKAVNEQLRLNREMDVDVNFGNTYAEVH